jgi:predicted O-methyltransferase YrrM
MTLAYRILPPRSLRGSAFSRLQLQRRLGWEPPEFTGLADNLLLTGRIEGWSYRQDLALLYQLARDLPGPGLTVEIGSHKGMSTIALAHGVRDGGHEPVHTVDPHTGDRQALEWSGLEEIHSEDEFKRNILEARVGDVVVGYTMTSNQLAEQWEGQQIRLLFIDGWHSYDAVTDDIRNWVPLLTPTGVVVVDDYYNYDDVRAAVDDAREILPPVQRRAGRMRLAHRALLPEPIARNLKIPWG